MKPRIPLSTALSALWGRVRPADEMARNRWFIAGDNYAFNLSFYLTNGSFLTGYLLLLHADNAYLGLFSMVLFLGNSFQFLAPLVLNRFARRRPLLLAARAFYQLMNIVLLGLAFRLPPSVQLPFLLAVTFFGYAGSAVTSPGVQAWHLRSIPEDKRIRFFSFLNVTLNLLNYVCILLASRVVDAFKADGNEMLGLTLLRVGAVVFAVVDLALMARIREYPEPPAPSHAGSLLDVFKSRPYLGSVAIAALYTFATCTAGPYFTAYLLQDVGMAYTTISLVSALVVPVMLLTTPLWTRILERYGLFRVFRLCILLFSLQYFALAFTSKATTWIYPVAALYSYVFATGSGNVMSNLPFRNLPEVNRTNALGFYAASTSVAAILGILLGRQFMAWTQSVRFSLLGVDFGNRQLILFLSGGLVALVALALFLSDHRPDRGAATGSPDAPEAS